MLEAILANDFIAYLITLGVFLITVLICAKHFKKYGFLQGIFSTFCIPMLVHGIGMLLAYIFNSNNDMVLLFENSVLSLEGLKMVFIKLFEQIGIKWFYETAGFYLPFGVIYILTYGYSITLYQKRKKKKDNKENQDENNK